MDRAGMQPRVLRHATLDSTQLEARRLIDAAPEAQLPFAVVAREQTAGRGREARAWSSPPGGLWVTGVWQLPEPPDAVLGLRLGLAVIEAISGVLPRAPAARLRLKWPNDIMCDERKVAGILAETLPRRGANRAALVGVGINVNVFRGDLPVPLRESAAILREIAGEEIDLHALLHQLLDCLSQAVGASPPTAETVGLVDKRLYHRGERVTLLRSDGTSASGVLTGLDSRGEPILTGLRAKQISGPFTGFAQPGPQT